MSAPAIERKRRQVPWLDGGMWYCPDPRGYCERCRDTSTKHTWMIDHAVLDMIAAEKEYGSWGPTQAVSPWDAAELEYGSWVPNPTSNTNADRP